MAKGIDVRQTSSSLYIRTYLSDANGNPIFGGTTLLSIYELQSDGTVKTFDFSTNTFTAGAVTTPTATMTHRPGNNGTVATGLWTYVLSTVTGFTKGNIYFAQVSNH